MKRKDYIAPGEAWKMLRMAKHVNQVTYIYGATGFGKTELVKQFVGEKNCRWYTCENGNPDLSDLVNMPVKEQNETIVVIDDLHLLFREDVQKKILSLIVRDDIWLILISRSPVLPWLLPAYLRKGMVVIGEEQLALKKKEICACLEAAGISLSQTAADKICEVCNGNAHAYHLFSMKLLEGRTLDETLIEEVRITFDRFLENSVLVQMDPELAEFLMMVSVVEEFDQNLAGMIAGNRHISLLLEQAQRAGNFLKESNGVYRIRKEFLRMLRRCAQKTFGQERVREFCYSAGLYYEMHDRIPEALNMYKQCGQTGRVKELLIRNARRNPGNGHYHELRDYYLGMEEQDIEDSAILISGMSMLYSLLMQPQKSEEWYERLQKHADNVRGGERREALARLLYLDIALPHRGMTGLLEVVKKLPAMLFDKGITLPEFSVTSNLPSVMNGGKDFCEWSRNDRALASTVGKIMERALGRYGKGFLNLALGESSYEKGEDTYEVLTMLSRSRMEAEAGGRMEIEFASVGIQVRMNLIHGEDEAAVSLLNSFEQRVREKKVLQILPNLEALRCRLFLIEGNREAAERWMKAAPDENREFYILERYRYLTKVRCYLLLGQYWRACSLLEKLNYYAESYNRTYIGMEVKLLMAIAHYRMGEKDWYDLLLEAMEQAAAYHFVRILSEEGAAILELLEAGEKRLRACGRLDPLWLDRIFRETQRMALHYPVYLKREMAHLPDFSENALAILRLQADGLSAGEIAERLSMKVENVRYHIKQNYKKLGVSGKADAVLAARNLKLL